MDFLRFPGYITKNQEQKIISQQKSQPKLPNLLADITEYG
jgi:hypothetical protein